MREPIAFADLGALHAPIRDDLDRAWHRAVDDNAFVGGDEVSAFEDEFARYCATTHCVGVSNGTDALELILRALDIGPGDEVIVPSNTFIATAEAVALCGATPVFVDVDPGTALITAEHVRAAIGPRTAAVMAVHLYGQVVDMPALLAVTEPAGVAVVEDAAQAHGATWAGRPAGSFGVAAGFSFYPGKNLGALGDGGAVTTSDPHLAERVRSMANHGRSTTSRYEHDLLGWNARLDGLQAALLRIKLAELDGWNKSRRALAQHYDNLFAHRASEEGRHRFWPVVEHPSASSVHHLYVIRCLDVGRDEASARLSADRIGWGVHYPVPCHRQAPFRADAVGVLPVVDDQADRLLTLPLHPNLSTGDVDRVVAVLHGDDAR